ncbi:MAG: hypothetical protein ND807_08635, partial [Vicinamibacterales bacterium]|nr:hypothetical protein [Vicinamibacterales bacterium]
MPQSNITRWVLIAAMVPAVPASIFAHGQTPSASHVVHACVQGNFGFDGFRIVGPGEQCRRGERRIQWTIPGQPGPVGT